jgi:hypothetical protein
LWGIFKVDCGIFFEVSQGKREEEKEEGQGREGFMFSVAKERDPLLDPHFLLLISSKLVRISYFPQCHSPTCTQVDDQSGD